MDAVFGQVLAAVAFVSVTAVLIGLYAWLSGGGSGR